MISFRRAALGSASVLGLTLAFSAPAFAQETQDAAAQPECDANDPNDPDCVPEAETQAPTGNELIVTGSRIRRPNLESQVPVTSIGGEEFFQQGNQNVGDTLNELPQLRSTFAQQNPGLGIGIAGLNLLDLRGLGTLRTLVLVNGRRHVAADILNNAVSVDVNTIPNDLIERVDVVTGGNSAVYGSDAIAGVVNFILRRDYEGIQVRGNAATSEEGFGGNQYMSILAGMNFADGRGNITGHVEYANQERIFGSDIPSFRRVDGFATFDIDPAGLVSASDGAPDAAFVRDIRQSTINPFGLIPVNQNVASPLCGIGLGQTNGIGGPGPVANQVAYSCMFNFTTAGRLQAQTGTRTSSGPNGTFIGGNGSTGREGTTLSVLPSLERINANILAHYEFSEALEVFAEAKATRVDIRGSNFGPSFVQGTFGTLDYRERARLDNPFLNPADRTTLANAINASNCRSDLSVVCPSGGNLTAADRAAILDGSYRFVISRNLLDVSNRDEEFRRDTFRAVAGLRGTFMDDWSYEVSANYGITEERTRAFGFLDRQRASLAFDAGRNPVTGQIQCRSQFDPASAVAYNRGPISGPGVTAQQRANLDAQLAADIAACVPYNPFGAPDNRASVAYFTSDYENRGSLDQLIVTAFLSGDSSEFFELPGGAVRFALGAEYRREELQFRQDPLVFARKTNAVEIPDILPPAADVKEAFGEIQIPLLSDTPFFEELTLSGAARVSEYNGNGNLVWTYNAGIEWSPIRDIRFRANYGRAVRAPNVSETASPLVANFAPGFTDPCSPGAIGGNANRAAGCAREIPANILALITNRTYSLGVVSGSDPNLAPEESDSYTIGAVITPRFLPGMSLTVDYYDITLNGQIVSIGAQTIANNCVDLPAGNVFCDRFQRNLTTGTLPNNTLAGAIIENSLLQTPLNFARRIRRGIDFEAAYRTDLGAESRLSMRLIYSHQFQNSNFENLTIPSFENRLLSELGDPQDEFRFNADLTLGRVTIGYTGRFIGSMLTNTYESLFPLNGQAPTNLDAFDITEYPSVMYHALRADFRIGGGEEGRSELNFFVGVDNLTDQEPPLGSTATGAGSAIYSIRGRNYYAGFRARF